MTQPREIDFLRLARPAVFDILPFTIEGREDLDVVVYGTTSEGRTDPERVVITGYGALETRLRKRANSESTGYDQAEVKFNIDPDFDASQYSDIEIYVKRRSPNLNSVNLEPDTDIAEEAQLVVDRLYRKAQELENRLNGIVNFPVEFRSNHDSDTLDEILRTPNIVPSDDDTPHILLYQLNDEGEMTLGWTQNIDEIHSIAQLVDGSVLTAFLADQAVTTDKIADGAVTTSKIADNAVTTDKILDRNVTRDKIEDGAIGGSQLAEESILTRHFGSVVSSLVPVVYTPYVGANSVQNVDIPLGGSKFGFNYVDLSTGLFNRNTNADGDPEARTFQLDLSNIVEGGIYELLIKKNVNVADPITRIYGPNGPAGNKVLNPDISLLHQQGSSIRVLVYVRRLGTSSAEGDDLDIYINPLGGSGEGGGVLDIHAFNDFVNQIDESETINTSDTFIMDTSVTSAGRSHISNRMSLEDLTFLGATIRSDETESIADVQSLLGLQVTTNFKVVTGPEVQNFSATLAAYNGNTIGGSNTNFRAFNSPSNTRKALVVENLLGVPEHSILIFRPPTATQPEADVWLVTDRDDFRIELIVQRGNLSSSISSTYVANSAAIGIRGSANIRAGTYHWHLNAAQAAIMFEDMLANGDDLIGVYFDVLDSSRGGVEQDRVTHSFADVWYEPVQSTDVVKVAESTVIEKIDDVLVAPKVNILAKQIEGVDDRIDDLEGRLPNPSTDFSMFITGTSIDHLSEPTSASLPLAGAQFNVILNFTNITGFDSTSGRFSVIMSGVQLNVEQPNDAFFRRDGLNQLTVSIPSNNRGDIITNAGRSKFAEIQVLYTPTGELPYNSNLLHLPVLPIEEIRYATKSFTLPNVNNTQITVAAFNTALGRLRFNNLTVGRTYRLTLQSKVLQQNAGSSAFNLEYTITTNQALSLFNNQLGNGFRIPSRVSLTFHKDTQEVTVIFVATATSLTFASTQINQIFSIVVAATLEELLNYTVTTAWN